MLSPSLTVAGPVFLMPRSRRVTLAVTVVVSSGGERAAGSLGVVVGGRIFVVLTTMVMAGETRPRVRVPTLQVTRVLATSVVHCGLVALTNVVPAGTGSVKVAFG